MSGEITLKAPVVLLATAALVISLLGNIIQAVMTSAPPAQTTARAPMIPTGLSAVPAVPAGYQGSVGPSAPRMAAPPAVPPGYTPEGFAAATGRANGGTGVAPAMPPGMMPGAR